QHLLALLPRKTGPHAGVGPDSRTCFAITSRVCATASRHWAPQENQGPRMTDLSALPSSLASAAHDLFDSLLADLSSLGARQHTRLLRLHTPLGPDVLMAERAQITQAMGPVAKGATDRIELLALSRHAHLQAADLLGQP